MADPPAIVVGVDGTPASEAALVFALREGARRGGAVEVVTAWSFPRPYNDVGPDSIERLRANAEHTQDETVSAALRRIDAQPVVSRSVVQGAPGPVLLAASRDADYLVVGTAHQKKNRAAVFFLGSVSQYCVRHATIPVMVVPVPARLARHRTHAPSQVASSSPGGRQIGARNAR
jgi:nucleotide-binding universal stress UspA family protein